MKQSELQSIEHLSIYEEKPQFIHIHTEEGYVVTDYKDGDDIKEYSSSVCFYFPYREDYPDYRSITDAEDAEYKKLQDEAINQSEMKGEE